MRFVRAGGSDRLPGDTEDVTIITSRSGVPDESTLLWPPAFRFWPGTTMPSLKLEVGV